MKYELVDHSIPCNWKISFPKEWMYEFCEGVSIFYPLDSELTVRVTPWHAEQKQGELVPKDEMEKIFREGIPEGAAIIGTEEYKMDGFSTLVFEKQRKEVENGTVFRRCIGYIAEGDLLVVDAFSTKKEELDYLLPFFKTIRKVRQ